MNPVSNTGSPGGERGSMGMKSADRYGSAGLKNMPIALALLNSITINSSGL